MHSGGAGDGAAPSLRINSDLLEAFSTQGAILQNRSFTIQDDVGDTAEIRNETLVAGR